MNRCLCVFSRILGWRIFGDYVENGLAKHTDAARFEYLDYDADAARLPVPKARTISDSLATTFRMRKLIDSKAVVASDYDAFIFQGHDLAIPFRKFTDRAFGIIADTTPAITSRRERGRPGLRSLIKRFWCACQDRLTYGPIFRRTKSFLVLSSTVKDSLVDDYAVDQARIHVVGPPIAERTEALVAQPREARPVLLFVGNDFDRKGGPFLLDLYRRYFRDSADLWIVSNGVDRSRLTGDIRVFSNISLSEVLGLMLRSHVFLFPSRHDELGLVLAEAACAGLPIVAYETGGQSEYVRTGENGYLLAPTDGAEKWKGAIESIISDESEWERLSLASRSLGLRLCSQARFDRQVASFVKDIFG